MNKIILVRFGEIFLKGLNRPFFMKKLIDNIKKSLEAYSFTIYFEDNRVYVKDFDQNCIEDIISKIKNVFGVHSLSIAYEIREKKLINIEEIACELMKYKIGTFKVNSKRSDKKFAMTSPELSAHIGACILRTNKNLTVDINKPSIILNIEVRTNIYVYFENIQAVGGMPIGTNGKATLLLSGGIDSPVAGWMIAKRGVELNAVHFFSFPYTSELALDKVISLAKILAKYTYKLNLFVVSFTEAQLKIHQNCHPDLSTIIMRRFMMRITEKISDKYGTLGLITGESIGQVASQTMKALMCTDCVVEKPIYRPLIGMDKQDIIKMAEFIGTFETSSLPYEDCCTVFTPKHPKTRPEIIEVEENEKKLNIDFIVNDALKNTKLYSINYDGTYKVLEDC